MPLRTAVDALPVGGEAAAPALATPQLLALAAKDTLSLDAGATQESRRGRAVSGPAARALAALRPVRALGQCRCLHAPSPWPAVTALKASRDQLSWFAKRPRETSSSFVIEA